jgi:putative NIF3 family GTP cyclohydrolase 1 type 2
MLKALGFEPSGTFFDWKGIRLGLIAKVEIPRDSLISKVSEAVEGAVHVCPGGPEMVRKIGLVTGGAGSEVAICPNSGVDTFITGEGPHWSYPLAEELGVNILYAGHYATETFGVKALADRLARDFALEQIFIDRPTGL